MLVRYGQPTWFQLGDRDLATHIVRTQALRQGEPLSAVTARLAAALGVGARLLPMTDAQVSTKIRVDSGWLDFQDYFVRRHFSDTVHEVRFDGIEAAQPAPGVLAAIAGAELIVVAPSNPFVSVGPILAVPGMLDALCVGSAPMCWPSARSSAAAPCAGPPAPCSPHSPAKRVQRASPATTPAHTPVCSTASSSIRRMPPMPRLSPRRPDRPGRTNRAHRRGRSPGTGATAGAAYHARVSAAGDLSSLHVVVPVRGLAEGKTRLGETLDAEERETLIVGLLHRLLEILAGWPPSRRTHVVSDDAIVRRVAAGARRERRRANPPPVTSTPRWWPPAVRLWHAMHRPS